MIVNPNRSFRESAKKTKPFAKKFPKNVREAFDIAEANESGIFQIEDGQGEKLYDRTYVFSDINYINKDDMEKQTILLDFISFLTYMQVDFKITIANEYRNMAQFIQEIFTDINKTDYPEISKGMNAWIRQKIEESNLSDVEKVLYLTVTCRAFNYSGAKSYFNGMDLQLTQFFSKMGSIILPLDGYQRLGILRKFFYLDEDETPLEFHDYKDSLNDVLPSSIDAGYKNFLICNNDLYVSVLFARRLGKSLDEGEVMRSLSDAPYPSFVTLDCAPVEQEVLDAKLDNANLNNERAISQEIDNKSKSNQLSTGISFSKAQKRDQLERYIKQVDTNGESCLLVGILVVVTASSEDELAERVEVMQQKGRKCKVFLETYNYVQMKALNTALPFGCRRVDHARAILSSSFVGLQPFYAQDLMEPGGQFLGRNKTTNRLVFANRKTLSSPHGMVVGHTGSGKSYFIKETIVTQVLLMTNDDLICIDPQNEMRDVCDSFGGQFIDFTPKSSVYINPMEIPDEVRRNPDKSESFVAEQSEWACSFCEAVMDNILFTQEHRSDIDKCIRAIYDRIFEKKFKNEQPTIIDLRNELKHMLDMAQYPQDQDRVLKIYNSLEEFTEGSYDMFSHPSNVTLDNRFTVYGLKNIKNSLWEPVMDTIMHFLTTRMNYNEALQKATWLVVDETQCLAEHEGSAQTLLDAVVTFRKFGGIVTTALQNLTRALENPDLRDMFSNCGFKIFFDQGGVDARRLAEVQKLSQAEYLSLAGNESGRGVLVWDNKVILLDCGMNKDNPLYPIFNTNFHEKSEEGTSGSDRS